MRATRVSKLEVMRLMNWPTEFLFALILCSVSQYKYTKAHGHLRWSLNQRIGNLSSSTSLFAFSMICAKTYFCIHHCLSLVCKPRTRLTNNSPFRWSRQLQMFLARTSTDVLTVNLSITTLISHRSGQRFQYAYDQTTWRQHRLSVYGK